MPRLIAISGTGTGIGKTHFAEALLRYAARDVRAAGLKPVESGATGAFGPDSERLHAASSFHVKHPPPFVLPEPLSPHLAAERAGRVVTAAPILAAIARALADVELLVVELPGGLYSPLSGELSNATLLSAILEARFGAVRTLLVAPDRLGVLHEVIATTRAAAAERLPIDGVVLSTSATPDSSTGTNEAELRRFINAPVLGTLPFASPTALADTALIARILA